MRTLNICRLALSLSCLSSLACSQVSFNPAAEENQSLESPPPTPQPPEEPIVFSKENFDFDGTQSAAKVDVLFVVDNSSSMSAEQSKLASRLSTFIQSISRMDWQIGIITTNEANGVKLGELVNFKGINSYILNKYVPNYANVFAQTVVRDEVGGAIERPLESLVSAVKQHNTVNSGFFRSDADLAAVILSDEDERSDGHMAIAPGIVKSVVTSAFSSFKKFTVFGIILEPGDKDCLEKQKSFQGNGKYGNVINSLVSLTGGITGSICAPDYSSTLEKIGGQVLVQKEKVMKLKNKPHESTLQLAIKPFDSGLKWEIKENEVHFNKPPKIGTHVEVTYVAEKEPN